ncbi:MAG TPA: hypothetical protein VKU88_01670 [Acidimicrobiales bacterium]|nr:hypothetical protein [Acidimicrobiales bacterium]
MLLDESDQFVRVADHTSRRGFYDLDLAGETALFEGRLSQVQNHRDRRAHAAELRPGAHPTRIRVGSPAKRVPQMNKNGRI